MNSCYQECYIHLRCYLIFFFNDTATTEIYTLSLHDALPISVHRRYLKPPWPSPREPTGSTSQTRRPLLDACLGMHRVSPKDRKSTRLNSSHANISYAVFCLKKKKKHTFCYLGHQVHSLYYE